MQDRNQRRGSGREHVGEENDLAAVTQRAIDVFFLSKQDNGEMGGIGYWQTANGYTAVALHDKWSSSTNNARILQTLLQKVERHHPFFINEFNDDTLWWAHCLLELFYLTHDPMYVQKAIVVWHHVSESVIRRGQHTVKGMDMQGGVFWSTRPNEDNINSITTGLYSELSARLAIICSATLGQNLSPVPSGAEFRQAAETSLRWIVRCRYREHDAVVLDTIKLRSHELVDWTFTYTTGQLIASAAALFTLTRETWYLDLAKKLALASMKRPGWVEQDGTLTESGAYGKGNHEAWKNDDAVGFKSVLVRSLAKLCTVLQATKLEPELQRAVCAFVRRAFDSLQERDTNGKGQYGPWWAGPMDLPTSHSQLAILDVMAAMRLIGTG
ncbi:hypothetical protein M8818_000365 [Zalaria obscura]|uniref:Uncharacterized protein n=1 Tax=Zalaria obscura TaxID=2024903 RepID=A0ACC3SPK6_9PEZI